MDPFFENIHHATLLGVFAKVVVQGRAHAEPRKQWEPKEGCEVLHRLPEEECPFIIQPKPLKDDELKALHAVSATFRQTAHVGYHLKAEVRQFWEQQEQYQQELLDVGLKAAHEAPQDFFKVLLPHDSYGEYRPKKRGPVVGPAAC